MDTDRLAILTQAGDRGYVEFLYYPPLATIGSFYNDPIFNSASSVPELDDITAKYVRQQPGSRIVLVTYQQIQQTPTYLDLTAEDLRFLREVFVAKLRVGGRRNLYW